MSIITTIPEFPIYAPVGTTEASYGNFGYRGIYILNYTSQKINMNLLYHCLKYLVNVYIQSKDLDNLKLNY